MISELIKWVVSCTGPLISERLGLVFHKIFYFSYLCCQRSLNWV